MKVVDLIEEYRLRAMYNHWRISWNDKTNYINIHYLPSLVFRFRWNEWIKEVRVFGLGASYNKLPF